MKLIETRILNKPEHNIACAISVDSDQLADLCSLISILAGFLWVVNNKKKLQADA